MQALHDHVGTETDDFEGGEKEEDGVRQIWQVDFRDGEFRNVHFLHAHEDILDPLVLSDVKKFLLLGFEIAVSNRSRNEFVSKNNIWKRDVGSGNCIPLS